MKYKDLKFPEGFLWGSAASSHQTEGGNTNDWSEWEKAGKTKDGSNADITCDHYNRYEEDFDLAKELGHQVHRFSIEWSRIEPKQGKWNETEIKHYKSVTKALVDRNIQPMVTLHHFTNPLWFCDMDSWLNPSSPEIFVPYARKMAEALAEFNVIWNTINEPMVIVAMGHLFGEFPPAIKDYSKAMIAANNLLMAHGQAATQIREAYNNLSIKQPKIAPILSMSYFEPHNPDNEEDVELAAYFDNLYNHVWLEGVMESKLAIDNGPRYKFLDNSADFIGVNYYSRIRVSSEMDFLAGERPPNDSTLETCEGLDWEVYPSGYYPVIQSVWDRWKKPIFLTENGIGASDDSLKKRYLLTHLQQVHCAIQDGIDILGYLVWSLTDNFEWNEGFSSHFGLIEINYDTLERKPRESAYMFHDIIQNNGLTAKLQEKHLT